MWWNGEKYLKEAKILESLNHPNLVNFKNVCYQPLAIMFEFVSFTLQTHHVDSTLKQRGNGCFHVVSTWNPRGGFVG